MTEQEEDKQTGGVDKVSLARRRAELVAIIAGPLSVDKRAQLQGALSIVNAKIKALNTIEAARNKAAADRKRAAGIAEAQANAVRARARLGLAETANGKTDPVRDLHGGDLVDDLDDALDDGAQVAAIDAWIVAVLQRGGVKVHFASDGNLDLVDAPAKWVNVVNALCSGIHAAARGEELPEVTAAPKKARKL